jgi:hypothetical protein
MKPMAKHAAAILHALSKRYDISRNLSGSESKGKRRAFSMRMPQRLILFAAGFRHK